jgi:hypothetical protein
MSSMESILLMAVIVGAGLLLIGVIVHFMPTKD